MILMNSSSLISPSPSLSASSIISCNSSSVIVSPSSLATLLKFLRLIFPVSSSSKSLKAFLISSRGSLSAYTNKDLFHNRCTILTVIRSRKSWYSMVPVPSLSTSAIIFLISSFLGSNPRALIATLSSLASILPKQSMEI